MSTTQETSDIRPIGWYCVRCKSMVDYEAFRCNCTISPSPWAPVYKMAESNQRYYTMTPEPPTYIYPLPMDDSDLLESLKKQYKEAQPDEKRGLLNKLSEWLVRERTLMDMDDIKKKDGR